MRQRLAAIMRKEITQLLRDRHTLVIQLSIPIIMLLLIGYSVEMQVTHIPTVVVDDSRDQRSWAFLEAMETSSFFDLQYYAQSQIEAIKAIDDGQVEVAIVIPPDFGVSMERGDAQALVLVDGTDALTVQSAFNAAITVGQAHAVELLTEKVERSGAAGDVNSLLPLDVRTRVLYNPDMSSLVFMVPGMIAMILQQQTIRLTAASIVRERELGTMEQILVTPIRPWELILGKIIPNVALSFFNMTTILILGVYWFGVPIRGSVLLLYGLALVYVFASLGLGILISTRAQNQLQSAAITMLIMLPGLMLSGYVFPRSAMPAAIRWMGELIPMTHFIVIARAVMTKGVGLSYVRDPVLILLVYSLVVVALSIRAFKERLE